MLEATRAAAEEVLETVDFNGRVAVPASSGARYRLPEREDYYRPGYTVIGRGLPLSENAL